VNSRVEHALQCVQRQLDLDAETQRDVLDELRGHLEEAVESGRRHGLSEDEAVTRALSALEGEDLGTEFQRVHAGEATTEGVMMAGLPVLFALILRWLVFAPEGTVGGWREVLIRPAFWVISVSALLAPWLQFSRRRHAVMSWAVFWVLTVVFAIMPASRW